MDRLNRLGTLRGFIHSLSTLTYLVRMCAASRCMIWGYLRSG